MNIKHPEAPGRGGKGGRLPPPNVLQDRFSNSSNSGVKIAVGGGGKADDLGNYNVYEYVSIGFYSLAILIPFSHDLYSIDSNFFLVPNPPDPRSTHYQRSTYFICHQDSF